MRGEKTGEKGVKDEKYGEKVQMVRRMVRRCKWCEGGESW